ncbi:MAG: hypothetical protein RXO71_05580 [Nitrososphaeria archaeon]
MKKKGQAEIIGALFFIIILVMAFATFYYMFYDFSNFAYLENQKIQQEQIAKAESLSQVQETFNMLQQYNVSSISSIPSFPSSPPYLYLLDGLGSGLVLGKEYTIKFNITLPYEFSSNVLQLSGKSIYNNPINLYIYALNASNKYNLISTYEIPPLANFMLNIPISSGYIVKDNIYLLLNASSTVYVASIPQKNGVYYVNLTLFNDQYQSTPSPFQQKIVITSSETFWQYINTAKGTFGQNVEFLYNNNILPSWLENYTNTSATWWVSIPNGIKAKSSITIQMAIYPKNTNLFGTTSSGKIIVGEAPQLSPVYGEYDSGFSVFPFYDDFAGSSLSSKWTEFDTVAGTISVNNGLIISPSPPPPPPPPPSPPPPPPSGNYVGVYASVTPITSTGMVLETLVQPEGSNPSQNYNDYSTFLGYGTTTSSTAPSNGFSGDFWGSGNNKSFIIMWSNSHAQYLSQAYDSATQGNLYLTSFAWTSAGNLYVLDSNGAVLASTSTQYSISSVTQVVIAANAASSGKTQYKVYWVRIRAYPPNGVMPSVIIPAPSTIPKVINVQLSNITLFKVADLSSPSLTDENITVYYPQGYQSYLINPSLSNNYNFKYDLTLTSIDSFLILDLYNPTSTSDQITVYLNSKQLLTANLANGVDKMFYLQLGTLPSGALNVSISGTTKTGVDEAIIYSITPNVVINNTGAYPVHIIRVWSLTNPPVYKNISITILPGQKYDMSQYFIPGTSIIKVIADNGNYYTFYY